jgi:hypothetical protein
MPLGFAAIIFIEVVKFVIKGFFCQLKRPLKPRRGCLFKDLAHFSHPFFLFFGSANLGLEN